MEIAGARMADLVFSSLARWAGSLPRPGGTCSGSSDFLRRSRRADLRWSHDWGGCSVDDGAYGSVDAVAVPRTPTGLSGVSSSRVAERVTGALRLRCQGRRASVSRVGSLYCSGSHGRPSTRPPPERSGGVNTGC